MTTNDKKKLTSVKIDPQLWDLFKIECIKRKFSFQKLSNLNLIIKTPLKL